MFLGLALNVRCLYVSVYVYAYVSTMCVYVCVHAFMYVCACV